MWHQDQVHMVPIISEITDTAKNNNKTV